MMRRAKANAANLPKTIKTRWGPTLKALSACSAET